MALVIKDKPLTMARVRAGLIYRLGAVPRVAVDVDTEAESHTGRCPAGFDRDVIHLRRLLEARDDEVAMLRLQLDVARSDARQREERLGRLEDDIRVHARLLARFLRATYVMLDGDDELGI